MRGKKSAVRGTAPLLSFARKSSPDGFVRVVLGAPSSTLRDQVNPIQRPAATIKIQKLSDMAPASFAVVGVGPG